METNNLNDWEKDLDLIAANAPAYKAEIARNDRLIRACRVQEAMERGYECDGDVEYVGPFSSYPKGSFSLDGIHIM